MCVPKNRQLGGLDPTAGSSSARHLGSGLTAPDFFLHSLHQVIIIIVVAKLIFFFQCFVLCYFSVAVRWTTGI